MVLWRGWSWLRSLSLSKKVSSAVQEPGNDHRGRRPELKYYLHSIDSRRKIHVKCGET